MKPATIAPVFACLYPGLCDVARRHGYALAVHGTVATDLDLIAVPWAEGPVSAKVLRDALMEHIGACGYADLLRRECPALSDDAVGQIVERQNGGDDGELKPHGRLAWNLYLGNGVKVDLSVMPMSSCDAPSVQAKA